jgi:dihydrofolate synthase/folylpolyglutamate synthase
VVATSVNEIVASAVDLASGAGGCPVYRYPETFRVAHFSGTPEGSEFDFCSDPVSYLCLKTRLAGHHQAVNAAAAVKTCLLLAEKGYSVEEGSIRAGLTEAPLPGRFERLWHDPLVLCDGAHNPSAIRALVETLAMFYPGRRFTFVVGILRHKNEKAVLRILSRIADRFVFVQPNSSRAIPPEELREAVSEFPVPCEVIPPVPEALRHVLEEGAGPVCVTGSFYTVGEAKQFFRTHSPSRVALT